jgi:CRP-like cAMP-binding protein
MEAKVNLATEPLNPRGPVILGVDPWATGNLSEGKMHQLLSDEQQDLLAGIASVVRFKKGAEIYRSGSPVKAIFNIVSGVVKSCSGDDPSHIVAFLYPGDLFGLSADGAYVNSAKAITPVTAYQLPLSALRARLAKNAALEYQVICKLCLEARHAQRHALLLGQRHATAKIATFLKLVEQLEYSRGEPTAEIYVPMDRSDIADYVGMTLPAVSRTFTTLAKRGVIASRDRRHVRITDRRAFESIVAVSAGRHSR